MTLRQLSLPLKFPIAAVIAGLVGITMQIGAGANLETSATLTDGQALIHVMPTLEQAQQHPKDEALPLIGCQVSCPTNLKYHGGPIQASPRVFVTFWGWHGSDPSGVAGYLQAYLSGLGGSPYGGIQTQYHGTNGYVGNPSGQLWGTWWDDGSTPNQTFSRADLVAEAERAATHFGYHGDANYFVATPHGTTDGGFGNSYCAFHGNTSDNVRFTFMPYMPDAGGSCGQNAVNSGAAGNLDGVSIVGGHEWAETITDPDVHSGYFDRFGDENGDKCAWSLGVGAPKNIYLSSGRFAAQSEWSNAAQKGTGKCVFQ